MSASSWRLSREGEEDPSVYSEDPQRGRAPLPEMSSSSGRSATEARARKVHSEAERRRRERINAHLATLRRMIPGAKQMDKATLLARVVGRVKDLKRKASAAAAERTAPLPREGDEVTVECYTGGGGGERLLYMKACVSCDDRPGLVAGLIQALRGLRLRTVRAEMSSLGGRVRHVFTLCREEAEKDAGAGGGVCLRSLKEAVRQALARAASSEMVYGSSMVQSKRQRILDSYYSIMST